MSHDSETLAAIDAATAELRAENERLQQKLLDIAVRIHGDTERMAIDIAKIIQGTNPERGE